MRGSCVLLPALLAAPFATANGPTVRPLNEQVALVTGASSGIGLQAAKYLAAQGTAVVLAARRTDRLNAAVTEITEAGGRAVVASCDVRRGDMLKAAVALAEETFGGLDFVFANAGIGISMGEDELETAKDEQIATNVAVNLIGSGLLTLKYALPALKRRGGGAVVFTSSIAAYFNKVTGENYEQMTAISACACAAPRRPAFKRILTRCARLSSCQMRLQRRVSTQSRTLAPARLPGMASDSTAST